MKKKALILYYSQCGQTKKAIDHFSAELGKTYDVSFAEILPKSEYAFPWKITKFFRAFPRCVQGEVPEIAQLQLEDPLEDFDLIVIGYQIWFLSPSLPIQALMDNHSFKELVKNRPVVGLVTARNMWFSGVSITNRKLKELGAKWVKNLVLCDTAPSWATFVTTPRWMLTGKKEAFSIFPEAGIAQVDFQRAQRFAAALVVQAPDEELVKFSHHQSRKNILMEKIGRVFFECWSAVIYRLTHNDGLFRDFLLLLFRLNLVLLILFLLPSVSVYLFIFGKNMVNESDKLLTP